MHVLVASNSISLSSSEGRIYRKIYSVKSVVSSHYFIKSIISSCCIEDTPGDILVHTLVDDKCLPAHWVVLKTQTEK